MDDGAVSRASWTTPADLRSQAVRWWQRGLILGCALDDEPAFPRRLTLKGPSSSQLGSRYDEARAWITKLSAGARHYRVVFEEVRHRQLGANQVPTQVWIDTREDAAAFIGKTAELAAFDRVVAETRQREPRLLPWLRRRPLAAVELAPDWPRLLDVAAWLEAHPRPGLYLRQVDVPGVDSKFLERHRGVLAELLDLVLPHEAIRHDATGRSGFELRYGFRSKPVRIRFRVLDPALSVVDVNATGDDAAGSNAKGASASGMSASGTRFDEDVTVPVATFATLALDPSEVFIVENEIDFLSFPARERTIVIFGAGYGFDALADIAWLRETTVHYWGDIDTHGFAILHQLRGVVPHARSFLMDRDTLLAHPGAWGREPQPTRRELERLDPDERSLYDDLRGDVLGEQVRLEQERIRFSWLKRALGGEAS